MVEALKLGLSIYEGHAPAVIGEWIGKEGGGWDSKGRNKGCGEWEVLDLTSNMPVYIYCINVHSLVVLSVLK